VQLGKIFDWVTRIVGIAAIVFFFVAPQFTCTGSDAPLSNLTTNLQSVRAQLELYRLHHNGEYPKDVVAGLTKKTDSDGTVTESGELGPYMLGFPANPFVDDPVKAVKSRGASGEGWFYKPETGGFFASTPGHANL